MSATIDRSLPIAVTLTAEQWQMVMQVLSKAPYEVVAQLIGAIQQQCMRHAEPLPEHMVARPNGEEQPDA
jgi:hypothetical protein